jgi:cytosine deaminase
VYCALHNNVLEDFGNSKLFLLHDPTAHGERQLVDWYFKNRKRLKLPDPSQLSIITTLDPCAMCAGALLTAGFNVGVSAIDDYAGINYNAAFEFPSVPAKWRRVAQASFAYYGVEAPIRRKYRGGKTTAFASQTISAPTFVLSSTIFEASVNDVREADNNSGQDPSKLTNPKTLPQDSIVRKVLLEACPEAFSVSCSKPRIPGRELAQTLVEAAKKAQRRGAAFNSVAFLDPFGNLLLCLGGVEDRSPIRTRLHGSNTLLRPHPLVLDESSRCVRARASSQRVDASEVRNVRISVCPRSEYSARPHGNGRVRFHDGRTHSRYFSFQPAIRSTA